MFLPHPLGQDIVPAVEENSKGQHGWILIGPTQWIKDFHWPGHCAIGKRGFQRITWLDSDWPYTMNKGFSLAVGVSFLTLLARTLCQR
jgi:hypothetical protein